MDLVSYYIQYSLLIINNLSNSDKDTRNDRNIQKIYCVYSAGNGEIKLLHT